MVAAAYLMEKHAWTLDEALEQMRRRRPGVRPNRGILPLLREWEELLKNEQIQTTS
jgi:protein-tyrosine phosphatase